jgi:hypothetical protein
MTIVLHVVCYLYRDNVHGRQIYNLFVRALETGQTASLTRDFLSRCESITIFFLFSPTMYVYYVFHSCENCLI